MNEVFCDGVSNVILSRGLVTIDFFHLVYSEESNSHKREPFCRLTIPVNGVLEMVGTGNKIVNYMVKIGMLPAEFARPVPAEKKAAPAGKAEKKSAKASSAPAKKAAPAPAKAVPAKKADVRPAAKPAEKPAPAKKAAPAPAKKADAKPAAKPAAPAKKPAAKGKKPAK